LAAMTATSIRERSGLASRAAAVTRPHIYAITMTVLLANSVASKVMQTLSDMGPGVAVANGLGLSWAFWLAFAACIRLAAIEQPTPARPRDLWVCAACLIAAIVPLSPLSALACTALAVVILADRTQEEVLKASAMVLLAISAQLLWSRLLMLFFLKPIASFDAHLVSAIIHRAVVGNAVEFADGSHRMSILGACTSVQNASIALMLYVAIVRSFRHRPIRSELYALSGVFLSVIVINIIRLALMAQNLEMFHLVHGDVGGAIINAIITLNGLAWAVVSVRREIFD
jgi:exosortase/archaeosortase family protein